MRLERAFVLRAATIVGAVLLAAVAAAQQSLDLPTQTLTGQRIAVSTDLPARPSLLIVGFTRSSRTQTSAWSKRVSENPLLTETVATYQVAMLEDVPTLLRGFVTRSIRSDVPDSMEARFLIVTEQTEAWKKLMSYSVPDAAYLALLDSAHKVIWRGQGEITEGSFQALQVEAARLHSRP